MESLSLYLCDSLLSQVHQIILKRNKFGNRNLMIFIMMFKVLPKTFLLRVLLFIHVQMGFLNLVEKLNLFSILLKEVVKINSIIF